MSVDNLVRAWAFVFLLAVVVAGGIGAARSSHSVVPLNLPSKRLTPGWLNPEVKPGNIMQTVCVPGYSSRIRPPSSYTGFMKKEELRYRTLPGTVSEYQLDHMVSLSLGGSAFDTRDLWLQSQPQASKDDVLEAQWHRDLCAGRIGLRDVQAQEIAWKRAHG